MNSPIKPDRGPSLTTLADTGAALAPPKEANLVLAGENYPVAVQCTKTDAAMEIALVTPFGQTVERERYSFSPAGFALVEALGDTYEPALTLLKLPFAVGESWTWRGQMTASLSHAAEASVKTSRDQLNLEGFSDEAIKVRVDLAIDIGASKPAMRTLSFWFVPGKGLLKREFGDASARLPVAPADSKDKSG